MLKIKSRSLKFISSCLITSLFVLPFITSCSSKKDNSNAQIENVYETYSNSELKNNKLSTVGSNRKLDIVLGRGADDIYDADFSDGRENKSPLLGEIVNEQYKKLAQISFSVNFYNSGASYLGTAWILDYQLVDGVNQNPNGNSYDETNYPTKWYLATNTHVMDDLKVVNSIYKETNTSLQPSKSTTKAIFKKINNPEIGNGNGKYQQSSLNNSAYEIFDISLVENGHPSSNPAVTPIFLGFDYLKSSPNEFINNLPPMVDKVPGFDTIEEMADFSVFEIDFEKITDIPSQFNNNPHLFARHFSSNYANWSNKEQFKIPDSSLLKNKEKVENKTYYALGFPQEAANGGSHITDNVYLYCNKPQSDNFDKSKGSHLVKERHYNTFKNQRGLFDLMIGSPDFGYALNPINSNIVSSQGIVPYIYQGLAYVDQNGDMKGGSSGSIFVDEDNYIYGIHFASDFTAHVGINFALRSEGYDYKGAYGKYNLQPYDLIYGGYINQKQSYREQLIKLYGSKIKTNIFKKGLTGY